MRPLLSSLGLWGLALAAWAQSPPGGGGSNIPQIPFGQTYKDFQFPLYQNGQLSYTLSAVSAKGITINRAETTDLTIQIYTAGQVTTTITSPKADLYVAERIMRTKNTVKIDRADMTATAQSCDFDLTSKKYLLRDRVKVVLKHFDPGSSMKKTGAPGAARAVTPSAAPAPAPEPASGPETPAPRTGGSILDMPGAYGSTTNPVPNAPIPPVHP